MASRREILINLLHASGEIALATHSAALTGFPFATVVPFATDEQHRPVLLLSRLAEHTRNLIADPRASVSVARALGEGETARASLVGNIAQIEPSPLLVSRYLRFHPEGERFLQLGDFRFYRMEPVRIRVIGGFAQAGWLDGSQLLAAPQLSLEAEAGLIETAQSSLPAAIVLLGVDAYGADYRANGIRQRADFAAGPVVAEAAGRALARALDRP